MSCGGQISDAFGFPCSGEDEGREGCGEETDDLWESSDGEGARSVSRDANRAVCSSFVWVGTCFHSVASRPPAREVPLISKPSILLFADIEALPATPGPGLGGPVELLSLVSSTRTALA